MPINVDRYEELAGDVLKLYEEAERTMMRKVSRRLNRGITQPGWTEKKYGEMREVSREMSRYVDSLSKHRGDIQQKAIAQAYADAREAMISDARTFTELSGIQGLTPNTVKVLNIMSELNSTMDAADRRILRSVNDAYADIVGRSSAMVATGSITYREAVKQELEDFANRGITSFVDRAGRSWDMETYAEMATLTAIERATREGYTDTMREFEYDLAQISDHYGACPICEAWQGVIISVRGETRGYPTLDEAMAAGVFHPRCMHDFSVYYEGISPPGRENPLGELAPSAGYSVRAKQRSYERQIRKWKRRMAVAQTPEEERAAYARVRMYQDRVRSLVDEYNAITDPSVDHLPRKYYREGGRTQLSAAAKKLKPAQIPESQMPKQYVIPSALSETKAFQRTAKKAADFFVDNYSVTLRRQTRDDILTFFTNVERTGGIKLKINPEDGSVRPQFRRKTYNDMNELLKTLVGRVREMDRQMSSDYSALRNILQKNFYLSKQDRADIPDLWDTLRSKDNFVRIKTNPNLMSVDTMYQELSDRFPQHFSSGVRHPADQLQSINDTMVFLRDNRARPVQEVYSREEIRSMENEMWNELGKWYLKTQGAAQAKGIGRK